VVTFKNGFDATKSSTFNSSSGNNNTIAMITHCCSCKCQIHLRLHCQQQPMLSTCHWTLPNWWVQIFMYVPRLGLCLFWIHVLCVGGPDIAASFYPSFLCLFCFVSHLYALLSLWMILNDPFLVVKQIIECICVFYVYHNNDCHWSCFGFQYTVAGHIPQCVVCGW